MYSNQMRNLLNSDFYFFIYLQLDAFSCPRVTEKLNVVTEELQRVVTELGKLIVATCMWTCRILSHC